MNSRVSAPTIARRASLIAAMGIGCAGLDAAAPAHAQTVYASDSPYYRAWLARHRAGGRDYRTLEAQGFRYAGTGGNPPYVYYVYRRAADGAEYRCLQDGWKTGQCQPARQRDARILPKHVRIPDLERAGYAYQGLQQTERGIRHLYRQPQGGSVYSCPNEGWGGCQPLERDSSNRRAAVRARPVLD